MAIEIRELRINVTVSESSTNEESSNSNQKINSTKLQELKAEIVRECTQKILEKIKERQER
jgi:hypothetical protein